jgi:hypothetical protein
VIKAMVALAKLSLSHPFFFKCLIPHQKGP